MKSADFCQTNVLILRCWVRFRDFFFNLKSISLFVYQTEPIEIMFSKIQMKLNWTACHTLLLLLLISERGQFLYTVHGESSRWMRFGICWIFVLTMKPVSLISRSLSLALSPSPCHWAFVSAFYVLMFCVKFNSMNVQTIAYTRHFFQWIMCVVRA